jgi:hypothetical protein
VRKGLWGYDEGPEENRPLGRPRRRWEEILKYVFKKWDRGYGLD